MAYKAKPQKIKLPDMFPKQKVKRNSKLKVCMNCRKFWGDKGYKRCLILDTRLCCAHWVAGELNEPFKLVKK